MPRGDEDTIGAQPSEGKKERVDRELREFLEETRIILPGLELLFGFLLILPFNARFDDLVASQRYVYLACLVATAAAAALLVAPSARHRLNFRAVDKERLLFVANRCLIAGLVLVALSMALAVYLASSMLVDPTWAAGLGGVLAAWFVFWWFVVPLLRK
jgi:hypothetical protein